jgi:leucyl-tRNA synthetase
MENEYNHKNIEAKWQSKWAEDGIYTTSNDTGKPKSYILDMFPYPSGEGLHVGHPRGYIATDIYSRMKRMNGFNVLHPMGWDAFGLPAENFAIKNKVHPSVAVDKNVARFKDQLSIIGLDHDWSREINTTDPAFYKWTQWVFLQMFKKGLAYESYEPINWCPSCQTGLANEDVEDDGTCERCGTLVEQKPMRQWVLKITDYADRLLADLDKLPNWPNGVKEAQRNWIGREQDELGNVTYNIKDWIFSRQRYWGEPIPIIHCADCGVVAVPETDLPVILPEVDSYEPTGTGESPLADIVDWVNTTCPTCGKNALRETNTMPQWAGSSWYYLRYIDPKNNNALVDLNKEKDWMPVDVYVGGDHATRHLIYARFWHKFLFDIGVVSGEEPFPRLEFLGFILADDGRKMSKRWGNIVNPDDVINIFGADAFRLYEMFIGPFDATACWNNDGMVGTHRFIERVWRFVNKNLNNQSVSNIDVQKNIHKTIKKVTEDIEGFKFNTAISQMMICLNEFEKSDSVSVGDIKTFLQLLAPFAPHMTEELWHMLGEQSSIHTSEWPKYDESKIIDTEFTIAVQVNGKVRDEIVIGADIDDEEVKQMALASDKVKKWIDADGNNGEVKKVIYIKNKLVSIVL